MPQSTLSGGTCAKITVYSCRLNFGYMLGHQQLDEFIDSVRVAGTVFLNISLLYINGQ